MSHIFRTPAVKLRPADPKGERLWLYYGIDRGISVIKNYDGTYIQGMNFTEDQIGAAAVYYGGGREHVVSDEEWATLQAAGYGDGIYVPPVIPPDPIPVDPPDDDDPPYIPPDGGTTDPPTFGDGSYGDGGYGD